MDTDNDQNAFQTATRQAWDRLYRLVQGAVDEAMRDGKQDEWFVSVLSAMDSEISGTAELLFKIKDESSALIKSVTRENSLLRADNDRLRSELAQAKTQSSSAATLSYAAVTGRQVPGRVPQRKPTTYTKTVTVMGKNGQQAAQVIREKLKSDQNEIRAVIRPTAQAVLITCDHPDKLDKIDDLLHGSEGMTCTDRQMLRPQVRIESVSKQDLDTENFIHDLNDNNDYLFGTDCRLAHTYPNWRDKQRYDVIVELSGCDQQKVLAKRSVLVGFDSCRVFEHLRIRQCVQCLGLGHKKEQCNACPRCLKTDCKDRKTCQVRKICFRCGGNHVRKDCPEDTRPKCSVCLYHGPTENGRQDQGKADHPMLSRDCPMKRLGEEAMRRRTDYGS